MSHLMTHSLLSAWQWALTENPYEDMTTESSSYQDFLRVLNREPVEATPAMQAGLDFEQLVAAVLADTADADHYWYDAARQVAEIVGHGVYQYSASKEVEVDGRKILLYGRIDVLRAGVIYDIKFSKSYERGKYFDSTQHPMYLELVPEAERFVYVVTNGSNVWTESYDREDTPSIIPVVGDFLRWLELQNLMDVYLEKWKSRYSNAS